MFSIHICGGIGSQFLRYLAGVGLAIKSNIPASDIKVIFHPYDELHTPTNDSLYHNSCLISHFLDLPSGSLDFEPYNKNAKQFNFDNRMLILVLEALSSNLLSQYLNFNSRFKNAFNASVTIRDCLWIRGRDRKCNLNDFAPIVEMCSREFNPSILTNDVNYVESNPYTINT